MTNLRHTVTNGEDTTPSISASAGLIVSDINKPDFSTLNAETFGGEIGVNFGTNDSDTNTNLMTLDMNADGAQDIISGGILYLSYMEDGKVSYRKTEFEGLPENISVSTSNTKVLGTSFTTTGNVLVKTEKNGKVNLSLLPSSQPSGGGSGAKGSSKEKKGFLDINGDGLPDLIEGYSEEKEIKVLMNNGHGFAESQSFVDQGYISESKNLALSVNMSVPIGNSSDNSQSKSLKSGANISAGVSLSTSSSNTTKAFIDINGDGLCDIVKMEPGEKSMKVRFNLGNSFGQETSVPLPEWNFNWYEGVDMGDASFEGHWIPGGSRFKMLMGEKDILTPQNFFGSMTKTYANSPDWNLSANASLCGNFGASLTWSIALGWFGFLNITASAGAGVNAGESASGITVKMMDIDGDGFVDHVIRFPKGSPNEGVYYKKNLTGRAQLLSKIKLPGGGECRIDYVEDKGTPDMPGSRYVMSKVTMADSCGKDGKPLFNHGEHETTVEYSYSGGYFDRAVKESYGYAEVTAEYADDSKKILSFYNDQYYNKGMKKSESVTVKGSDGKDALISHVEYELEDNVPLVKKRTEVQLDEASGVQLAEEISQAENSGNAVKRTVEYEYDDFGNVILIKESGSTDSKVLEAEIGYYANSSKYIYSKPSLIEVKEDGKLLRKRSGNYNENGALTKLSQFYTQSEHTDSSYSYDSYGNVKTITGANGDVTEYKYDSTHNQYIEEISRSADGISYKSSAEWNKKLGKPLLTKDINGNSMKYTYDSWGRTVSVATDYDGDVPAVKYKYYGVKKSEGQTSANATASLWYTVTENKVTFDKNDTSVIKTLIASDGLGRTGLTAKTGVVRGEEGFNLSGQIEYDKKGRVVKEGKPYFMASSLDLSDEVFAETLVQYAASQEIKDPDVTEYDGADRVVSTTLSDGSLIKNEYSVEEGLLVQKSFDPDTEAAGTSGNYTVSKKDFRGNVVKLEKYSKAGVLLTKTAYEYDTLSQLKTAYDAENNPVEVGYDLLGRMTSLSSKDSGTKEWFYNSKGNLEKERDSVLKARNEYIEYSYDGFGRNTRIDYPQSSSTEIEYGTCEDSGTNAAGKVKKITDSSGSREYEYGLLGEVKKETRSIKHIRNYLNKEESAVMEYTSDYLGRIQEITYPDGEIVTYTYDKGGQVTGVTGKVYGLDLIYVKGIQYDEYGQRTRIEYGNGAVTDYTYDEHRRWLSTLHTDSRLGETLQNLSYSFDRVGNVLGYTNDCLDEDGNYTTAQSYSYDGLYQLTSATGESVYNPHRGGVPDYRTTYTQNFSFDANGLGKMLSKTSSMTVSQGKALGGDGLVYDLDYEYDSDYVHRLKRAGDRYYKYDDCGRLLEEKEGTEEGTSDTVRLTRTIKKETENVYSQEYGWGLSNDATREAQKADAAASGSGSGSTSGAGCVSSGDTGFKRTYTWDEKGRLTATSDSNYDVEYVYGEDNRRAVKSGDLGETLYFNIFWTWSNNSAVYNGSRTAKHIFLNNERIVTKLNSANNPTYSEESASTYYYHSDHLGSASVISDNDGREYERLEYTPYGEVWIDKASATFKTAYRFTGKERDEETGLYYFGERYLDGKVSRWLSCDPALSDFVACQSNGVSGGIFNAINMNLYHYAANNPIVATDPDGRELYIKGDDAYRQKVMDDIKKLAPNAVIDENGKVTLTGDTVKGYEKGTELIKSLVDDKNHKVTVEFDPEHIMSDGSKAGEGNRADTMSINRSLYGIGADAFVNFNPDNTAPLKQPDGKEWEHETCFSLAHELIHAKHIFNGNAMNYLFPNNLEKGMKAEELSTCSEVNSIIKSMQNITTTSPRLYYQYGREFWRIK